MVSVSAVITGLVPVIHALPSRDKDVDGRVKPGHDESEAADVGWAKRSVPTINISPHLVPQMELAPLFE
jgi:hypothetical protein